MRRWLLGMAVVVAAVGVLALAIVLTGPRRRIDLPTSPDGTIPGIFHVHTNRSDGLSSPDEVAAAAARAGLKFIIFTDHGDGTRTPDPPVYRSGVLCLDGVEISTSGGHYIAIDMPASPYPLAGEPRDVVEDVRRFGGFGIVAHPDSPKKELQWTGWTLPFDGVELLNLDTSWRVLAAQAGWTAKRRLLSGVLHYPFRAPEVMASLIQPTAALDRWEPVARTRRVVVVAGADAHAKLAPRNADPGDSTFALPLPGYESSFRVISSHVRLERTLTGTAADDARLVMRAIRNGHVYNAVDGVATPPAFMFTATNALGTVHEGDVLGESGPVQLRVQSNAPAGFQTIVYEGSRTLSSVRDTQDLTVHGPAVAGVYWAEIVSPVGAPPVTWIRSNPIYIRTAEAAPERAGPSRATAAAAEPRGGSPTIKSAASIFDGKSTAGWAGEHDAHSLTAVEIAPGATPELRYRFGLADGPAVGQFASLANQVPNGVAPHDAIRFTIRAERPMRVSVQVRDTTADRWQRSVYVDAMPQERTVALDDLAPVGVTHAERPAKEAIRSIMFVVDTTNTKTGVSGRIWIRSAALVTFER